MIFVNEQSGMDEVVRGIADMELLGLDCETTGLDPLTDGILLVQLGNEDEQYVIDARRVDLRPLMPTLCTNRVRKVLHNAKFDYQFLLAKTGIRLENVIDTMLVEQVIQNGRLQKGFGLAATYQRYFNRTVSKEAQMSFVGHTGDFTAQQLEYAAQDVVYPLELIRAQTPRLVKYGLEHTAKLECLAVPAVADMELNGLLVDQERWLQLETDAGRRAEETLAELDELFKPFREKDMDGMLLAIPDVLNYDSNAQMLPALQWLGVPVETTNKAQIGHLGKDYPIVQKLLDYREHRKNVTTYGRSFLEHIHPSDGRIHCDFRQMGAESGRMSSTAPNLQNIPSGSEYRECFVAPEGHVLVTADYSGCELRIIAELSGDAGFVDAFNAGEDLHSKVASQMFGKTVSKTENAELRNVAKVISFGLAYGMSHVKLAHTMKVGEEEAKAHLETYFKMFPKVASWLETAGRTAAARGFATTIGGRRRWFNIEGIDDDRRQRGAVERKGKNTPIQGTNADLLKMSLYGLRQQLNKGRSAAKIVNAVHDEIVVECVEDNAESVRAIVEKVMQRAGEYYVKSVPMVVESATRTYWGH